MRCVARLIQVSAFASLFATLACAGEPPVSPGFVDPADDPGRNGPNRDLQLIRSVDLLIVVDNSRSTARAQAQLATQLPALLEQLEAADIDYRIGVTTTDNGNPWCPAGLTTPEGGKLIASSCAARLDDFLLPDPAPLDVRDQACKDFCGLSSLNIMPTTTAWDDLPAPRPWLEGGNGTSNLAPGTELADALACMIPQGVGGCGFTSPLEAAYLSLRRSQQPDEPEHGFFRPGAVTALLFLTDTVDCSYSKDWATIFDEGGAKTFWSDPADPFPTQALCWNAGVECSGDPSGYDHCVPADKAEDGSPADNQNEAVLHPMLRYIDAFEALEWEQLNWNWQHALLVGVIAGFAEDGETLYAAAEDPELQHDYGVGPGCVDPSGHPAPPPVRLRALAEAFEGLTPASICAPSYAPMLDELVTRVHEHLPSRCIPLCPWDEDPETPIVDPQCRVRSGWDQTLPECERDQQGAYLLDAEGEYTLPADAPGCYALLIDRDGLSPDPADDLSDECKGLGQYLEVRVTTATDQGYEPLTLSCIESRFPELYCPELG